MLSWLEFGVFSLPSALYFCFSKNLELVPAKHAALIICTVIVYIEFTCNLNIARPIHVTLLKFINAGSYG